jgi:hypothetical protein
VSRSPCPALDIGLHSNLIVAMSKFRPILQFILVPLPFPLPLCRLFHQPSTVKRASQEDEGPEGEVRRIVRVLQDAAAQRYVIVRPSHYDTLLFSAPAQLVVSGGWRRRGHLLAFNDEVLRFPVGLPGEFGKFDVPLTISSARLPSEPARGRLQIVFYHKSGKVPTGLGRFAGFGGGGGHIRVEYKDIASAEANGSRLYIRLLTTVRDGGDSSVDINGRGSPGQPATPASGWRSSTR